MKARIRLLQIKMSNSMPSLCCVRNRFSPKTNICFVRHLLLQEIILTFFVITLSAAKIGYKSVPMYQTNFYGGSTVVKSVLYTKFGEARWHEGNQRDKQESTWACLSIRGLNWSEELF